MTYRIKVPPRTLPVGEEQLVSGLEHWLIGLKTYRWSLIVGFVLLLLMGMGLWGCSGTRNKTPVRLKNLSEKRRFSCLRERPMTHKNSRQSQ